MRSTILTILVVVSSIVAADLGSKVDSIVYEKPTEWRIYASKSPAKAFALHQEMLWIATSENVTAFKWKSSEQATFTTLGAIPAEDIAAIIVAQNGEIWFGGKNGIAIKGEKSFTNITHENGLPGNNVSSLLSASDGRIWVGTDSGLAVRSAQNSWTQYTEKDGLPSAAVQAIAEGENGAIIAGTKKGIAVLNSGTWVAHTMNNGLSWNDTKAVAFDPRTKKIWAAVGDMDVNCFENGAWTTYMGVQENITSIMVDTQSRIWVGASGGILKFNGDEWISDSKAHGVQATQISSMKRDESGNLFFAMESGVLRMSNPYPF